MRSNRNYNIYSTFNPIFIIPTIFSQLDEFFIYWCFLFSHATIQFFTFQWQWWIDAKKFTYDSELGWLDLTFRMCINSSHFSAFVRWHSNTCTHSKWKKRIHILFSASRDDDGHWMGTNVDCSTLNNDGNWLLAYIHTNAVLGHKALSHTQSLD